MNQPVNLWHRPINFGDQLSSWLIERLAKEPGYRYNRGFNAFKHRCVFPGYDTQTMVLSNRRPIPSLT